MGSNDSITKLKFDFYFSMLYIWSAIVSYDHIDFNLVLNGTYVN